MADSMTDVMEQEVIAPVLSLESLENVEDAPTAQAVASQEA